MKLAFASVAATLFAATSALALTPADPAQSQRDLTLYGPAHVIAGEQVSAAAEDVLTPADLGLLGFDDQNQYLFGVETAQALTASDLK
ncbi:hypothetical protein [Pseudooceanicola aestuarii]|uniref:hypothetical protein n=1 Tax=Pseudooceanicola aestuarii TaxID=2697319 RepID=UPI0013D505C5|nr:hypothetical protein [Pseudooceanicola aestuarii]